MSRAPTMALTVLIVIATGCVSIATGPMAGNQYECPPGGIYYQKTHTWFDPDKRSYPSPSPVLKLIELTNQGELVSRCQWTDALYELRGYGPEKPPDDKLTKPIMAVMYVHGWKHDARATDTDQLHFLAFLQQLAKREQVSQPQRRVVGIFVAWPGLTTSLPGVVELTFWSRQGAADRISQSAIVTKLIGAMNSIRRQRRNSEDFTVFIGHSFGARILYTGTSQLLLHDVQMQFPGDVNEQYGTIKGPADLMILLNPAFGASAYTALNSIRRAKEYFWKAGHTEAFSQQPVLLTISTLGDWATTVAYPLGQWLGFNWHERDRTTLGNYQEYRTHYLVPRPEPPNPVETAQSPWYDKFCHQQACLERRAEDPQVGNPFLVALTWPGLLPNHSDIWGDQFIQWLGAFIYELDRQRALLR